MKTAVRTLVLAGSGAVCLLTGVTLQDSGMLLEALGLAVALIVLHREVVSMLMPEGPVDVSAEVPLEPGDQVVVTIYRCR